MSAAAVGADAAEPVFVAANGLVKRYPGVVALDGVDLRVPAGAVTGLVGKNGAGKSTLIKVLAGVETPDAGTLHLDGEPIRLANAHDATAIGFAFVHQELALVPNLSVAENIELGLGYPRRLGVFVDQRGLRRKALTALQALATDIHPGARVGTLSVAQQRMVMIARGLATKARLLVLDEPTASLTTDEIEHLHAAVRTVRADGVAVLYVTHRLDEILELTDSVVTMRDGRVVDTRPTTEHSRSSLVEVITGGHDPQVEEPARHRREARVVASASVVMKVEGLHRPPAVNDVSFELRRGEILGIAGLVGAGRTELARLIFAADRRQSGAVYVDGREVDASSPRAAMRSGVVLLPEDRRGQGNIAAFTIRENVTLPVLSRYRRFGVPVPDVRRERRTAEELIDRLGIRTDTCERQTAWLSGGNQQKVVLAKWLVRGAEVFIFDEPTHGVDVEGKEEVYSLVEDLAAEGKGVIFISSEFNELERMCERVLIMREGRISGELVGDEITLSALVRQCYDQTLE